MLFFRGAAKRQDRRVLEQKHDVADLSSDAFVLEASLELVRFGVVNGSEATEQHDALSGDS
jgi:hypothetical protein